MRHLIMTAALALAVLGTGQALADESAAPAATDNGGLVIGGTGPAPATDASAGDDRLPWIDLRSLFSDATVSIGATPTDSARTLRADPGYNAYAQIHIAGFTVGGRFARWGEPALSDVNNESFGFGASYNLESWTVGIDWSRGDYDEIFLDVGGADTGDVIAFTSSYAVRPGVKINGLVEYSENQPDQARSTAGALTVGIGTLINF